MIRLRASEVISLISPIIGDADGRCEADAIRVGGDWTPGLCTISKAGQIFTWDKRKGYGYSGAWLLYTGQDLSEFDITFTVWRQDQMDAFDAFDAKYLTVEPAQKNTPSSAQLSGAQAQLEAAQTNANGVATNPNATEADRLTATALLSQAQTKVAALTPNYLTLGPRPKALGVYSPILAKLKIDKVVPKFIGQWNRLTGRQRGKWQRTISFIQFRPPAPYLGKPKEAIPDVKKTGPTADDAEQLEIRAKRQHIQAQAAELARGHN